MQAARPSSPLKNRNFPSPPHGGFGFIRKDLINSIMRYQVYINAESSQGTLEFINHMDLDHQEVARRVSTIRLLDTQNGDLAKKTKSLFLTGAVEWTRTITRLPPPAPQAGASTNSATTAFQICIKTALKNSWPRIRDLPVPPMRQTK